MTRPPLDPLQGTEVAKALRGLGVKDRTLIKAAELGYITQLRCAMPKCFWPEELGGRSYFEPGGTDRWNYWQPTLEHYPIPKRDGGLKSVDNTLLAHRLCNKLDFFMFSGLSMAKDLARADQQARDAAAGLRPRPETSL